MNCFLRLLTAALVATLPIGIVGAQSDHSDSDDSGSDQTTCNADAGALAPVTDELALEGSGVRLETFRTKPTNVPDGYEVAYVLTTMEAGELVILDVYASLDEAFVTMPNDYRLHTLVAELDDPSSPNYLDASVITSGQTTAADVLGLVAEAGICADLEVPGAMFDVYPCDVTGGLIFTDNGTNEIDVCRDSVIAVLPSYEVTAGIAYILADENYEILEIVTDPAEVTYADYEADRFNIFALTYTGMLNPDVSGSVYTQQYSSRCWLISDNEIIVRIVSEECGQSDPCAVITGGMIMTDNGTNEIDVCRDSVVAVNPAYEVLAKYAYILADANYEILEIVTDPSEVSYAGYTDAVRFNIFGLAYTGTLNTDVTGSVYTPRYSDECWQITDNEIIVRIASEDCGDDEEPEPEACTADAGALAPVTNELALEGGAGVKLETFRTEPTSVPEGYEVAYVLTTMEDGELVILDIYTSLDQAFVSEPNDYRLHTLVAELGDSTDANYLDASVVTFGQTTAADVLGLVAEAGICADLEVPGAMFDVYACDVTGGMILTENGTNETDICRDSAVAVFPQYEVTAKYAYVLADANYEILEIVTDPADVNFADYGDAVRFNIFGLTYTGDLDTTVTGSVYTPRYSSRCWLITDNEIIVRIAAEDCDDLDPCVVITGGKVFTDNGTNEIDVCRDSVVAVNPAYQVRAKYAYILADANYEILEIVTDPSEVSYAGYTDAVRFNIFGLAYTGTLNTDVTGSVYTPRYSDECWQITDNEIIVRIASEDCGEGGDSDEDHDGLNAADGPSPEVDVVVNQLTAGSDLRVTLTPLDRNRVERAVVTLTDANGRVVAMTDVGDVAGATSLTLSPRGVDRGLHVVTVQTATGRTALSIVVR